MVVNTRGIKRTGGGGASLSDKYCLQIEVWHCQLLTHQKDFAGHNTNRRLKSSTNETYLWLEISYSSKIQGTINFEVFIVLALFFYFKVDTHGSLANVVYILHFNSTPVLCVDPLPTKGSARETRVLTIPGPKIVASNHCFYLKETSCVSLEWQGS